MYSSASSSHSNMSYCKEIFEAISHRSNIRRQSVISHFSTTIAEIRNLTFSFIANDGIIAESNIKEKCGETILQP